MRSLSKHGRLLSIHMRRDTQSRLFADYLDSINQAVQGDPLLRKERKYDVSLYVFIGAILVILGTVFGPVLLGQV